MSSTLLVLHVDDDAEMRHVTALCLFGAPDIRVTSAESGQQALQLLEGGLRPHLILLDVTMPEMDGPATLTAIRALDGLADTPVVFLTGRASEQERQRYSALGAAGVIVKPFDPAQLADHVRLHAA